MKKELNDVILNYTNKDKNYIEELSIYIDKNLNEIKEFLSINKLDFKINIFLYDNLEEFRNIRRVGKDKNYIVPEWLCGFAKEDNVYTLCLEELNKTKSHKNDDIESLKKLIIHECAHIYQESFIKYNDKYAWLCEGFATTISHQYDGIKKPFKSNLNDMINGCSIYIDYDTMFKYVLHKYGKEYILRLMIDYDELVKITPLVIEKLKSFN